MLSTRHFALLIALALPALACAEEKSQVQIQADSVRHDEATGEVTYSGNVVVERDAMQIISETLVIRQADEEGISTITVSGNPLRFMNSQDGQTVTGNASTAVYNPRNQTLQMEGQPIRFQSVDARGQQLRGTAARADYDMERKIIRMSGRPVRFTQTPGGGKKPVTGFSSRADYDMQAKQLVLSGNATVKQDGSTVNNDRIVFNMRDSLILAGEKANASTRVETVLELE
jgi:lipopolysaccharide export system protein LptA